MNQFKVKSSFDDKKIRQYIMEFEGLDPDTSKDYEQFIDELQLSDEEAAAGTHISNAFTTTSYGGINGAKALQMLERQSIMHAFSRLPLATNYPCDDNDVGVFLSNNYSTGVFMGIMIDTGAAIRSTAGQDQFIALQQIQDVKLDKSRAGEAKIQFGIGTTTSLGTTTVRTPIGNITFHVVPANTPFLLCLKDLDDLYVKFDNLENVLIQHGKRTPIVRAYGHPWMLLNPIKALTYANGITTHPSNVVSCHLTEPELRQLHRRFGHPSARRMHKVLERAGHETNLEEITKLTKFCDQCQRHGRAPGRFKFTVRDDHDFNHTVFTDVLTIEGKNVIQIVDEGTAFQAARFLTNMSAECAWSTIKECWIDTYLGPPSYVVHDAGTNFASKEFRDNATVMNVEVKEVPVEAHNSIGLVERYHIPLRRAYEIISHEIPSMSKEHKLQAAVKSVNDTMGPDGLVPTLLVFGAYPRMTTWDTPATSITQRAAAIRKAMEAVRKCHAARKIADALRMRNGPRTDHIADLPLDSDVLVWR
jgi:hypothetical protein